MRVILTEEQFEELKKKHRRKKKKDCSAMAQVGGKVNSGIMIGITGGGMFEEGAEPESDEYKIGAEPNSAVGGAYYHINESPDVCYGGRMWWSKDAIPFLYLWQDKELMIGKPHTTHLDIIERLEKEYRENPSTSSDKNPYAEMTYEWDNTTYDEFCDTRRTGRYWAGGNIISFWTTPVDSTSLMYEVVNFLVKNDVITDTNTLLVDYWDKNRKDDNEDPYQDDNTAEFIVPYRWFKSGFFFRILNTYDIASICPVYGDNNAFDINLNDNIGTALVATFDGDLMTKAEYNQQKLGISVDFDDDFEPAHSISLEESVGNGFDLSSQIESLMSFMSKKIEIKPYPEIHLNDDEQDGLFIRTGYYEPSTKSVTLFTNDRHPKDILRSLAHELIHHNQNLRDPEFDWGRGGNLEDDDRLRKLEGEAYLKGNILFREWTEAENSNKKESLNESTDSVPYLNLTLDDDNAYPFITYKKKDGTDTKIFVGEPGEWHNKIAFRLIGDGKLNKEDFESLFDMPRNPFKTGRIWFLDGKTVVSFYSYHKNNYQLMYKEIVDSLLAIESALNIELNIGKVMVDFWTFPKNYNKTFIPVRWLNNGMADTFFPIMLTCLPETDFGGDEDVYSLETERGSFKYDWKGNEISPALRESKNLIKENAENELSPADVDLSSFNVKKRLNPKFWKDGHLDTRIRLKLLDVADAVMQYIDVDWFDPVDVIMTGSLANYNWNEKYSDIDLHILIDYDDIDEDKETAKKYLDKIMKAWKTEHGNINIFGFPVEVYIQDADEPHASTGVYSINKDKWLVEPDIDKLRQGKLNRKKVRRMVAHYATKIDNLCDIYNEVNDDEYRARKLAEKVDKLFDAMKKERKKGLTASSSEINDGNIMYKALRRGGYLQKIIDLKRNLFDKMHSLLKEGEDDFKVYMMVGLPGAGKSTWIKNNVPDLPVVSRDIIRAEIGMCGDGEKCVGNSEEEEEVTRIERERIKEYCSERQSFIIDDTNTNRRFRKIIVDLLRENGAKVVFVHLNTTLDVCKERRKNDIPSSVMDRIGRRFQPPQDDEYDEIIKV